MHFRQENSPPTDYGTLFLYQNSFLVRTWFICSLRVSAVSLTVRSPWSVTVLSTALFLFTAVRDSAVYRTISNTVGLQREWRYCDRFLLVHIVLFWLSAFSPWSKLWVIIWSMLRFRTTLHIPFANVFPSFEPLLHKFKIYFDSLADTVSAGEQKQI